MKTRFLSFITALSIMLTSALMFPQIEISAENSEPALLLNNFTQTAYDLQTLAESNKVSQVALGNYYSSAIMANGDLYTWGLNSYGKLGNGTTTDSYIPIKIMSDVASISLGYSHSAAITTSGDLYTWGFNYNGQLGNGTTSDLNPNPTPIKIMSNVASVSLGAYHSAAITTNGDLYMWGSNESGQLGNGNSKASCFPVKIMSDVASVSLGTGHSAAIKTNGDLYIWGYNNNYALGNGKGNGSISYIPEKIMSNVVSVVLGNENGAAITTNGDLYMWGRNEAGQLGNGTTTNISVPEKIMSNVTSVSLGFLHSAAITTTGDLYMCGSNVQGQIGDGTATNIYVPKKIMNNVTSVNICFASHSSAINTDGDLYTWGNNVYGQLGNGTKGTITSSSVPIKIQIPYGTKDEDDFIGEATNNIGIRDVLCGDFLSVEFSNIISPLYPTSFDSYEVISSNPNVAEIVNTYDYTNGTEPLRYVSAEIHTKNEGSANIICKFNNAVVGNNRLKEYSLVYTVNVRRSVPLVFNSPEVCNGKATIYFDYSDTVFSSNADTYNYELSKLSSIMAASAYDYDDAKANLDILGFDNIYDSDSYNEISQITKEDNDKVAYTFATKNIYINNQKNTVVAVIIKGTSKNEEWYSNFNVGENNYNVGDRHTGFETAKRQLMTDLSKYLSDSDKDIIPSKTKFWITGHSRGAGVGNLLAADITDGKLEIGENCPMFIQNNIYAYLYAPPSGVVMDYSDISHDNIYNFINPQDFVPRMPLQKWNYSRYGNDYVYPNEVTSKYEYNITLGEFRFKSSEYQKLLIDTFYNLFDRHIDQYLMKNGTSSTIKICNDLYSIASSVDKYYNGGIYPYVPFRYFYDGLATAAIGKSGTELALAVGTMLGYTSDTNVFNIPKWNNLNQYFIAGSHSYLNNTVTYSHTPETYIAWAYVCNSVNDFDYNLFVKGIYACPVDIEVYDSHNNLVGRVVNNKVDESVTKLEILVDEETSTKTVFMPASEQFTVKALGYDNGTMDYSIELCDITDLSTSDLRSVDDIEITPNTTVTTNTDLSGNVLIVAVTDDGDTVKTVEYTIDENNIVTTKTTTTDNNTPSFPNDSDNNHYTPSNPPSGGSSNVTPPASSSDIESFNVKVENKVTGETKNIIAVRNGENVTVDIGKENNGYYANIYTNNGDFIVAVRIEKGEVKFFIPKDVKFNIIIDEYSYGEDVSSGAGANDSGSPIDMASPITNGVCIPKADLPRGFRISNKKRKYRILKKRRLDDLVFVF